MIIRIIVFNISLLLLLSSCSIYKNRGRVETTKDVKTEKKAIEFKYAFFEANKQKMLGNYTEAGSYYLRCIELDPESAAANYEFAGILALMKDLNNAIRFSKKAYEIDPYNKWYESLLISLYKSTGDLKKSIDLLEDMLEKHPDDYNSYIELTDTYLQSGKLKNAIETLEQFEKKYGYSEALMIEKNRIFIQQGQYSNARLEVQKMIKLEPEEPSYYIILADLYSEEGLREKAFEIYQDVLKLDPENGQVHFSLSQYYQEKGDEEKAFEELKKAINSDQVDIDLKIKLLFTYIGLKDPSVEEQKQVYELLGNMLEQYPNEMKVHSLYSDILVKDKQFEEARKELLIITEHEPNNVAVWEQLLYIDNQLGDYQNLFDHSTKMIEYFPNRAIAYFFAGLGGFQIKKYTEAAQYLENGLDFAVNDTVLEAQFYTILGDTYHRLKNHKKSDNAFEKAVTLNPKNYYVHNNYAYYLSIRAENLKRAKELIEDCIKTNSKNGTYLDTYAWVLYQNKEYKKALDIIKRSYDNGGKNSDVIVEHYGDILFKNSLIDEAVSKWKEALEIGKGSGLLERKIFQKELIEE